MMVYTAILLKALGTGRESYKCPQNLISSPATKAVRWETKMLDTRLHQQDEYVGGPTPQADKAWNDLIDLSNIKIPSSDIARAGLTSIPIPDEPDMSWASLGVIHELHCLSRLRMSIWTDHYYADFSDEERELNRAHSDHCLDYLRQAAMCHGDVSLTTYRWTDDSPLPVADFASPKVCVNWDALADWQRERLWDPLVPGLLKHPKFGAAFPDGNGSRIGVQPDGMHQHHTGTRSS
ncbi:hypothetical protein F5X97DRAFT_340768 [Nemania serpens]|nr:hypothetical protein F5X97DRAFT_340768 [Nemania serpens]